MRLFRDVCKFELQTLCKHLYKHCLFVFVCSRGRAGVCLQTWLFANCLFTCLFATSPQSAAFSCPPSAMERCPSRVAALRRPPSESTLTGRSASLWAARRLRVARCGVCALKTKAFLEPSGSSSVPKVDCTALSVLGERGVSGDSGDVDGPAVLELEGVEAAQEQEPVDGPAAVDGPASLDGPASVDNGVDGSAAWTVLEAGGIATAVQGRMVRRGSRHADGLGLRGRLLLHRRSLMGLFFHFTRRAAAESTQELRCVCKHMVFAKCLQSVCLVFVRVGVGVGCVFVNKAVCKQFVYMFVWTAGSANITP